MRSLHPALLLLGIALLGGCEDASDLLAPYEAERPLTFLAITRSATPDIQWVGGRVAAVGVNRGTRAALDSTLVWVTTSDGNDINSYVTVGARTDEALIRSLQGTPVETLEDETTYTFWIAEKSALDAQLNPGGLSSLSFADSTFTTSLVLSGRSGGDPGLGVVIKVTRDERLLGSRYIIDWTPGDVPFRRIAISAASSGRFTDLIWHVAQPEGEPDAIYPPVVIGTPPPGTQVAQEWTGFQQGTHTLWMVTDAWTPGEFSPRATGYAFLQLFAGNFE